ncbi:hypothetical protein AAG589_06320 [Isoptericola sp. F-RaC21]|uniref:hypothetical protein n=1 Tax=Isoptericola sp. F-RaC21 TaxID=3141452 RepID=UPI00315BF0DF
MTRKVRATAERFPELGALRHVETAPPSPVALTVTAAVVVVFALVIVLGSGDVVDAAIVVPFWVAIAALILWYMGSEKLLVMDRGIIMGSHAPFLRPFVIPFVGFEASSVTACRPVWKLAAMLGRRTRLRGGRNTAWTWNGVAFVSLQGSVARRPVVDRTGILRPDAAARLPRGVFWFGTWRETGALLRALEAALVAYGAPEATGMAERALPQVSISGSPADAPQQVPRLLAALDRTASGA